VLLCRIEGLGCPYPCRILTIHFFSIRAVLGEIATRRALTLRASSAHLAPLWSPKPITTLSARKR
jgi:hypothetical protein